METKTKTKTREEIENDIWFANQLEALRQIEAPHIVDITDAVMQRIDKLQPLAPKAKQRHWWKATTTAIAACITGVIIVFASLNHQPLHAATTTDTQTLSLRMMDIYDYCHEYSEQDDDTAINENPLTVII